MIKKLNVLTAVVLAATMLTGCAQTESTAVATATPTVETQTESDKPTITLTDKTVEATLTDSGELDTKTLVKAMVVSITEGKTELKQVTLKDGEKQENGTYVVDTSKVDLTKAGEYEVAITAKGTDGNTVKKTCKVTVTEDIVKEAKEASSKKETASTSKKTETSEKKSSSKKSSSKKDTSTKSSSSNQTTTTASKSNNPSTKSNSTTTNNTTTTVTNNNIQTPATPAVHQHSWTYHPAVEATGHNEQVLVKDAWDETVQKYVGIKETAIECSYCHQTFQTSDAWSAHLSAIGYDDEDNPHIYASYGPHYEDTYETQTIHHDAEYTTQWVQDTPGQAAYYSCSCGATQAA